MTIVATLQKEFSLPEKTVTNILALIDEGNTIPFIARYRKEQIGAMDDQRLRELADRLAYLRGLEKRREEILSSIEAQDKLSDALRGQIAAAATLAELDDIYRPFRPKRRTRATMAKEKGLEPLALFILSQEHNAPAPHDEAQRYLSEEVASADEAIQGALDIIAEIMSDDAGLRKKLRTLAQSSAMLSSTAAKEEDSVYSQYYAFSQSIRQVPSHRILAVNRGEKEGFLKVSIDMDDPRSITLIQNQYIRPASPTKALLSQAAADGWQRLLRPSLEREIRAELSDKAAEQAIAMFGLNLRPLLMQPPLKGSCVMGFDPAYRTGCKIAIVDAHGACLDTTVVYPTPPHNKKDEAKRVLAALIQKHNVSVVAIGNGTASKESEIFIAELIKELPTPVSYAMVNEAGASVYSASKLGAQEFPDFDVSLRSAVSIARRLQDPLAELVKIDPKAIGVGQYQHDMPQKRLDETLGGVVESCVNAVGVDVNTASPSLLGYVSGLNATTAKNVFSYRQENGPFSSRSQLKKVPKLGAKAFEQCAGFLRIAGSKNIFDNTGVHPESYGAAKALLALFGYSEKDVAAGKLDGFAQKLEEYGKQKAADACGIGLPTLNDIVQELLKPGRDVREGLEPVQLRADILSLEDLRPGMELRGTVRNVIDFGAFVDIGVHQDGLVHVSQLADRFVKHPLDVVKVGQQVTVWVIEINTAKKRISLTMKKPTTPKD